MARVETDRQNVSRAEVHVLEAGYFTMDEKTNEVIALGAAFGTKRC